VRLLHVEPTANEALSARMATLNDTFPIRSGSKFVKKSYRSDGQDHGHTVGHGYTAEYD